MKKVLALTVCMMICAAVLFSGCSSPASLMSGAMENTTDSAADYAGEAATTEEYAAAEDTTASAAEGIGDIGNVTVAQTDRKLVYSMNLSINTNSFDADYQEIMTQLKAVGGYVEYEDVSGRQPTTATESGRSATLTLRVPVDSYETFTEKIAGIGTVVNKSQQTEDYSDQYYDVDARIELLEEQKQRLMDHLAAATDMQDIIDLENEISNVIYQLDDLKGQQRGMDRLVEYATVRVNLNEYLLAENLPGNTQDTGAQAANAFAITWKGMGEFFRAFGIGLAAAAPILILLAIIAVAVVWIIKGIKVLQKNIKSGRHSAPNKKSNPRIKHP